MVAVDICNLALSYLGDTATVASLDPPEGSAQAQHCARFYPMAVKLMLESHDWNFITTRVTLALLVDGYSNEWRYSYALPADTNTIISVLPKCLYPFNYFDVAIANYFYGGWYLPFDYESSYVRDFLLEVDSQGRQIILTNAVDAVARYTTTTVQPGMFSGLFTDALVWKLAAMLAGPLLKGEAGATEAKRCLQMFAVVEAQAMGQDANQQHYAHRPVPAFIKARN